jgi:hypothetical protein
MASARLRCARALGRGRGAPHPFGHSCEPHPSGVLFCPTRTLADRVPSFESTPLDVTLPASSEAGGRSRRS